jgi:hypothetical protein
LSGKVNTVYLAGKITGDSNYKSKFAAARKKLEQSGFVVLDPSILPATGFDYDAYIRMSAAMLDECEAVCFLCDWQDSGGARSEHARAQNRNIIIFYYDDWMHSIDA